MRQVGIIGGGAAGMGAAYALLEAGCGVTLFEAGDLPGGNCFGVDISLPGGGTWRVDGGIGAYNRATYRRFDAFLDALGVERVSVTGDVSFMAADRETVWSSRHGDGRFRWIAEVKRFEREAPEVLVSPFYDDWTIARYLDSRGYSEEIRRLYLYPRAAGCLGMSGNVPGRAPIRGLAACWRMHGTVGSRRAEWTAPKGGMHRYGAAFARRFVDGGGRLLCARRVVGVARDGDRIRVRATDRDGAVSRHELDDVVLAVAPDQAVGLLDDATVAERILASTFASTPVRVVVHRDERLMPRDRAAWGAYNYCVEERGEAVRRPTVTRWSNLFAGLPDEAPDVFVTTNPRRQPDPARVLADRRVMHPESGPAVRQRARLVEQIQGRRHTWFCGGHLREPFLHEQALATGLEVAARITGRQAVAASPVRAVA